MDKKPFLEADSFSADQIPLILWRQRFHYRIPKSRPLLVFLFPCDRSVLFSTTTPYACLISPIFHMPLPSHAPSFDHPNTGIWRSVNIVTLIRSFLFCFYVVRHRAKSLPHESVLSLSLHVEDRQQAQL